MAELDGKRLALDEGGRPRVDDGGRLVYVDVAAGEELPEQLEDGQGVHTPEVIDPPELLHPENTQPVPPADEQG